MIERLDGAFTTTHDFADLGIREVFAELEHQELLAVCLQLSDRGAQCLFLGIRFGQALWAALAFAYRHQFVKQDHLAAGVITMPVGDEIMGDSVEPSRKGDALILIALHVAERAVKRAGGQVFGIVHVSRS